MVRRAHPARDRQCLRRPAVARWQRGERRGVRERPDARAVHRLRRRGSGGGRTDQRTRRARGRRAGTAPGRATCLPSSDTRMRTFDGTSLRFMILPTPQLLPRLHSDDHPRRIRNHSDTHLRSFGGSGFPGGSQPSACPGAWSALQRRQLIARKNWFCACFSPSKRAELHARNGVNARHRDWSCDDARGPGRQRPGAERRSLHARRRHRPVAAEGRDRGAGKPCSSVSAISCTRASVMPVRCSAASG